MLSGARKEPKVNSDVRLLRTPAFDFDYRLCRCEGFRVDSPGGRVGIVEEVHFRSRIDRPDVLVVRTGATSDPSGRRFRRFPPGRTGRSSPRAAERREGSRAPASQLSRRWREAEARSA